MKIYASSGSFQIIHTPETELLTLYPDSPPTEMSIQIGISASANYIEKKDKGADILPALAIAATPLAGLKAGERYKVELKDWRREFPGYVRWWDWGERKDILKARGEERGR